MAELTLHISDKWIDWLKEQQVELVKESMELMVIDAMWTYATLQGLSRTGSDLLVTGANGVTYTLNLNCVTRDERKFQQEQEDAAERE